MTNQLNIDFSTQFDVLYNNITSNQAPGLNPYEKSVIFTRAQDQIVEALYNGTLEGHSFEETEELRRKLDILVRTAELDSSDAIDIQTNNIIPLTGDSVFFDLRTLKEDDASQEIKSNRGVMFITLEQVIYSSDDACLKNKRVGVKPVTQDEYDRIKGNPFRGATENRALRLDYGNKIVEIIPKHSISKYIVKYMTYPEPIVLDNLSTYSLNIGGVSIENPCKLDKMLHKDIIDRAVMLAKVAWQSTIQQQRQ